MVRTVTTSFQKIFEYWKDKCITEDGKIETEGTVDFSISIPVIEDWGEPECFACRLPLVNEEDYNDDPGEDPSVVWGKIHGAERAHIVPHCLGGADSPENLFCLCRRCHRESPDSIFSKEFFRWVYKRRKGPSIPEQAAQICVDRGLFPAFCAEDISKAAPHNLTIGTESLVAALVGSAEKNNEVCPNLRKLATNLRLTYN